jgi:hypothetical protein
MPTKKHNKTDSYFFILFLFSHVSVTVTDDPFGDQHSANKPMFSILCTHFSQTRDGLSMANA